MNTTKVIIYSLLSCLFVGSYVYLLNDDISKLKMSIVKNILIMSILIGTVILYRNVESNKIKGLLIFAIIIVINIYTVISSTKKCDLHKLYIFKLILGSSLLILVAAILIWINTFGNVFGFKLGDDVLDIAVIKTDIIKASDKLYKYSDCPKKTDTNWEKKYNILKRDKPEKAKQCLSYYNRVDTESDVYK